MQYRPCSILFSLVASFPIAARCQQDLQIPLVVAKGTPLRVYLIKRISKRPGEPLRFGTEAIPAKQMALFGSQPSSDSSVQARLVTPIGSDHSRNGDAIEAIVSAPLLVPDHKLVLPEGTHLLGKVTMSHRAKWFHRGGQLRFNFEDVKLPEAIKRTDLAPASISFRTLGYLQDADANGKTQMKVDQEGGVKATESKTRFLAPVLAALVASRAADNDINKTTGAPYPNTGGHVNRGRVRVRSVRRGSGEIFAELRKSVRIYGLGWSIFRNVIARGQEAEFPKNAAIEIRFAAWEQAPSKLGALQRIISGSGSVNQH